MRSECDVFEDVRIVKTSKIFNRRFLICLIAGMMFLGSCGVFFKTTYLYAMDKMEAQQKAEDEIAANNNSASRKTYYIEQRLRQDIEKMLQQGK